MNLAEIRKKAQKERVMEEPSAVVADVLPSREEIIEAQAPQPARLQAGNVDTPSPPPSVAMEPAQPLPMEGFDPLAVLLAGRASALSDAVASGTGSVSTGEQEDDEKEWLCFKVGGEKYAIDIMEIKEIIKPREVTEVPRVPPFVIGIISLRGIIIPVFDMQKRLGHQSGEATGRERVIVVKKGEEFCGVLADEVIQVAGLNAAAIEPPPAVLEGIDRDFVGGIGRVAGEMMIMLNLDKVLDTNLC